MSEQIPTALLDASAAELKTDGRHKVSILNLPYGESNPYQRMMYWPGVSNYTVLPGKRNFRRIIKQAKSGQFAAVHLHWDDLIFHLDRWQDQADQEQKNNAILNTLKKIKDLGIPILFSVHNARPHRPGASFGSFVNLRRNICDLSDVIHVHTDYAADHICLEYRVNPDKIRLIPHPSYLGVYEASETTLARQPIIGETRNFLFFGAFRQNKGIARIADALSGLEKEGRLFQTTVSGKVHDAGRKEIEDRFAHFGVNVLLNMDRVPDLEVPALFSGSDFFLAPFNDDVLSSGTIMLAQTFGLPVIGANTPAIRSMLPESNHPLLYDPAYPDGLVRSMRAACELSESDIFELRKNAFAVAQACAPHLIASRLSHELDCLIGTHKP